MRTTACGRHSLGTNLLSSRGCRPLLRIFLQRNWSCTPPHVYPTVRRCCRTLEPSMICRVPSSSRQAAAALAYGYPTRTENLLIPQGVSGVGGQDQTCRQKAVLPGCLADSTMMEYCPTIIPDSEVPPLLGLTTMARNDVYFGTKLGRFVMIPPGTDDQIIWPKGTRTLQMVKAPSGHWLLTVSGWSQVKEEHSPAKTGGTSPDSMWGPEAASVNPAETVEMKESSQTRPVPSGVEISATQPVHPAALSPH